MRVDKNDTEIRIIEAARTLFNRWGYAGMSLRQIATEVGIEKQSIYNYTSSKQALVEKMIRTGTEELYETVSAAIKAAEPTPDARLRAAVKAHVVHYTTSPNVVIFRSSLIHFDEDVRTSLGVKLKEYEQLFKVIIHEGMESGDFLQVDVTPVTFAILGMGDSVTNWWRPGGRLDALEVGELYSDLALRMVTAPADLSHPSIPRSTKEHQTT